MNSISEILRKSIFENPRLMKCKMELCSKDRIIYNERNYWISYECVSNRDIISILVISYPYSYTLHLVLNNIKWINLSLNYFLQRPKRNEYRLSFSTNSNQWIGFLKHILWSDNNDTQVTTFQRTRPHRISPVYCAGSIEILTDLWVI